MSRYNTYTLPLGPIDNNQDSGDPEVRQVISSTVAGVTSSSTGNILLYSLLIPANTYKINEVLDISAMGTKTGTTNTCVLRFYLGTTASLTGATQLGTCTYAAGSLSLPLHRRLAIRSTTAGTVVFRTSQSTSSDIKIDNAGNSRNNTSPGGCEVLALDWTQERYLIVSGNVTSASDIIQIRWAKINN